MIEKEGQSPIIDRSSVVAQLDGKVKVDLTGEGTPEEQLNALDLLANELGKTVEADEPGGKPGDRLVSVPNDTEIV